MAVNSVNSQKTIEEIIAQSSKNSSSRNTGQLGKDDFLNLLVTQLRYQDPLKPVDDKEFIAQMAQFSALEQMQNMNSSLSQSHAFSLIGKNVVANTNDEKSKEVKTVEGIVSNVKISGGKTYVVVNGEDIPVDKVIDVSASSSIFRSSNLASYTNLIGYNVKGAIYDSGTSNIVAVQGNVKAIEKGVYEDYAVMDGVEVEISEIASDSPSTDPDYMENYLKASLPKGTEPGKEVDVVAYDSKSGHKVTIKATLQSYRNENGKTYVTVNNLYVPVESISKIAPATQNQTQIDSAEDGQSDNTYVASAEQTSTTGGQG